MGKRLNLEEIKALYENENREILDCEIREVGKQKHKKMHVKYKCLIDKYEGWTTLSSMRQGTGCLKCANRLLYEKLRLSLDDIKLKLKVINPNIEILSDEYINANTKLKCKCLIDNHVWYPKWGDLSQGQGCPACSGRVVSDKNRLSLLRPDLIKYFKNTEDADSYTVNSGQKVQLKCPECGMLKTKEMSINNLSGYGFSCDYCSDGISIPEKFGINLLKQLNIEFKTQKRFDWARDKKYDFFLEINNKQILIEVHGLQHYEEINKHYSKTLKEEQANDMYKFELALLNDIELDNYIVVDCRYSEFEWLKENYTKQFSNYFDLSNVNWNEIWEGCQLSLVVKVWDAWNNRSENDTTKTIGDIFDLERNTIIKYLKCGNKIGKCSYDPHEESKKSALKRGKNGKIIYQYNIEGNFIQSFYSMHDANRQLNISISDISKCCNGKLKTAGGFKWSFSPPVNNKYNR